MTIRRLSLATALGLTLAAVGCHNDDLFTPPLPLYTGAAMFQRYVSMGNSLTAGFQSGGINDSTQRQSYPVKVAAAMGGAFYRPSLTVPGCPPPFDVLFTPTGVPHRLGGATASTCAFRSAPPPPFVSNVAVPGATVLDPYHAGPTLAANPLTQLILGGRSQVQAMRAAQPTFVSAWIGNNDVLAAATDPVHAGDPTKVTPLATFQARYDSLLASIDSTPSIQGGILIGVADVAAIPYFSYGKYYFGASQPPNPWPPNLTVSSNCAPASVVPGAFGDTVLVPFAYGFGLIGQAKANPGTPYTLDCTDVNTMQPAELANLHAKVAAYNSYISGRATGRRWAYLDPNGAFATLRGTAGQVNPFPNTAATSCNGGTPAGSPFGLAFSCDGVHPSSATHRLIAQAIVQTINATYNSAIPAVP